MDKLRVLFLCTENSSRSQMAEAVLRRYAGDVFESHSAGLQPRGVDPLAVKAMKEVGIDISAQRSKTLEMYSGKTPFQYLITVCDEADRECPPAWSGVNTRLHWSFADPAKFEGSEEQKLAKFREVRDQIQERIRQWVVEQYIFADY